MGTASVGCDAPNKSSTEKEVKLLIVYILVGAILMLIVLTAVSSFNFSDPKRR